MFDGDVASLHERLVQQLGGFREGFAVDQTLRSTRADYPVYMELQEVKDIQTPGWVSFWEDKRPDGDNGRALRIVVSCTLAARDADADQQRRTLDSALRDVEAIMYEVHEILATPSEKTELSLTAMCSWQVVYQRVQREEFVRAELVCEETLCSY